MDYTATLSEPGLISLLTAFSLGVGTSFTPCVYPLIPITLSIFGAGEDTTRLRAFLLSCTYVLGMSTTYTLLGLFAASTGAVFGSFLGSTPVILSVTCLLVVMAGFTLDLFQIPALHKMQSKANTVGGKGVVGAYLMGILSGVVAAPCVGPVLVAILAIAASSANTVWGGTLLATYSLGLGLIFIFIGTFSGLLARLPRSGNWMYGVKFLLASALLFLALFFLQPLLPKKLLPVDSDFLHTTLLVVMALSALGSIVIAIRNDHNLLKFVASALLSIVLFESILADDSTIEDSLIWQSSLEQGLLLAAKENKPVFVDLSADWCAACKELEKLTFPDPAVQKVLKNFILVKIDFTTPDPEITEKLAVVGLPLMVFLDSDGNEVPDTRLQYFVDAKTFVKESSVVLEKLKPGK